MTVSSIGFQTNNLQAIRAQSAFQRAMKSPDDSSKNINVPLEEDVKVSLSSRSLNNKVTEVNNRENDLNFVKKNPYINEIKEFANKYNITDIEEDDIKEALQYGTSLFANHIA